VTLDGFSKRLTFGRQHARNPDAVALLRCLSLRLSQVAVIFFQFPDLRTPFFNISSALYMQWVDNSEYLFDQAPTQSVEATGVPELCQHLLSLAADQNHKEYEAHIHEFFPGLIAKISRVVDPNRSEGFKIIAQAFSSTVETAATEFDDVLRRYLDGLTEQTMPVLLADRDHYVDSLDLEADNWKNIRFCTFRKMMHEHGVLVPGASKVASMRRGYNINRNIARLLTPAFRGLARHQKPKHLQLAEELHQVRKRVNNIVVRQMDNSESDLQSIEEAKKPWAPRGLALTTPINRLVVRLNQIADSLATLAARETDYTSFIAKQTADIFNTVYTSRPRKVLKTLQKRKSSSNKPVVVSVYEQPHSIFARELLLKLLKDGHSTKAESQEGSDIKETEADGDTNVIKNIMVALDRMVQKRYKMYGNEFVDGIRATMQEFLDEVQELALSEVTISKDSQAARSRLGELVEGLKKNCDELQALVPRRG
jgi:hypothetical protein